MSSNSISKDNLETINKILASKIHYLGEAERYQAYVKLYKAFVGTALNSTSTTHDFKKDVLDKAYKNLTSLNGDNSYKQKVNNETTKCLAEYFKNQTNEDCFTKMVIDESSPSKTYGLMKASVDELMGQLKYHCYEDAFEKFKDMNDKYFTLAMSNEVNQDSYKRAKNEMLDAAKKCENLYPFYTEQDSDINSNLNELADQYLVPQPYCIGPICW